MHVQLSLKSWKIIQDETTKQPKPAGKYAVMMGEKEVAVQDFNEGYSAKAIPFSIETMKIISAAEIAIKTDLEKFLS